MPKDCAELLTYRLGGGDVEVMLVHPGGLIWMKKDAGAWSIPKGEIVHGEEALDAARREFEEETGFRPGEKLLHLGEAVQKGGKIIRAWAFKGDCDPASLKSNTFVVEWPPRSGKKREFPEIDRAGFFAREEARNKINSAQIAFIDALERIVGGARRAID